ncbi:MAG: dTMP kinase [Synechococcaceae cyanobacterium SM2_3_2]|nr:dTMP kinase [Synechococcaceae cyanobacterium SM2_3_2]
MSRSPSAYPGLLITFEGGEGSGKTTQLLRLADHLRQIGWPCVCTREPGGTQLGQALRQILLHETGIPLQPLAELLLYITDRSQNVAEVIRPALEAGQIVLCDRFIDSTIAYQGYGRGLDREQIRQLNQIATQGILPDVTLWLKIEPEIGLARAGGRAVPNPQPDRMEQTELEFHRRIAAGLAEMAQQSAERIVPIDAQGSLDQVAAAIWHILSLRYPHLQNPPPQNGGAPSRA